MTEETAEVSSKPRSTRTQLTEKLMPQYETAVVRLLQSTNGKPLAGMGVLVGIREVVTCAHVVNAALGRNLRERDQPEESSIVQLEFPLLPGAPVRNGRIAAWMPPGQRVGNGADVAGLVLNEDAPSGAAPARLALMGTAAGTRLRVFGYPGTPPRGEGGAWVDVDLKGPVGTQLLQVESRDDQTIKAQPGYSGSPVWLDSTGVVIGLLRATAFADEPYRDAYLVPPSMVAEAWEEQFQYLLRPDNPYRGLEPFTAEHAAVFFGRDADREVLIDRVMAHPVVMVVGPSGVGKSSLVQAGLLPQLQRERTWSVAFIRPGQDPWYRLAIGIIRAQSSTTAVSAGEIEREIQRLRDEGLGRTARFLRADGRPLLIIVDQFEEFLASGQPPDSALLDLLLPPSEAADDAIRLVHTLRADFLPSLLAVPGMGLRLDNRLHLLSPLTEQQIREAIRRPAAARSVEFQGGLVDQIVSDAATGSLPLLQFTLTRLWQTQRRKLMDFNGYHAMGGVRGALDRFAEQQVSELRDVTAEVIDRVLLRLVRTAAGDAELATLQRVYQSTVPSVEWEVLRQLASARLVIVDNDLAEGPYAELVHEALITSWQRLHNLVRDNADFLDWLAAIRLRAAEGDPLPEARIAEARRWLTVRSEYVPGTVRAFIDNSQTVVEARVRELTEARNRAEIARERAEATARRAEALRLASASELALRSGPSATTVALALAAESVLTDPTVQGDFALRRVLRLYPRTLARLDRQGPVNAVSFASGGMRVAAGSSDGSARVFDAVSGSELARLEHRGPVRAVAFAPDGMRVATGSSDGSARVFDAATGSELARLDYRGPVRAVAFARMASGWRLAAVMVRRGCLTPPLVRSLPAWTTGVR